MSFLHAPGDLSRTPLAAILLEALNVRATGVLSVDHGGGTSRLYFRGGAPVGAQVFGAFRPLGHLLLQAGLIDIDALSRSLVEMARTHRPQGELLVEAGAVSRADVDRALTDQQEGYFAAIAALEAGAFRFEPGAEIPAWTRGTLLSPLRTIVDALERPQAQALVLSALQPVSSAGVRLASGYAALSDEFRWTVAEEALLAPLAQATSVDAFFAGADEVAPERARAILAGLLLLNLAVSVAEQPAARGDTAVGLFLDLSYGTDGPVEMPEADEPIAPPAAAPARAEKAAPPAAAPVPAPVPAAPGKRSDPDEARARRQRLLQRAMHNMGIGPLAGRPRPEASPTPPAGTPSAADDALRHALLAIAPRAGDEDLFARLGLPPDAGREDVKGAYLKLAKAFHPDRFSSPHLADLHDVVRTFFTSVNEAYEVLSDDAKRAAYLTRRQGAGSKHAEAARLDFQKAEVCLRAREWVRARGFYEAAVRADPRPEYLAALAWTYVVEPNRRDRTRAQTLLEQARRDPRCARALHVSGLVAREDGDEAAAERFFRATLAVDPRHVEAQRELRSLEGRRSKLRG